ncbi:MAG: hypothetical protein IKG21_09510 [Atopobiaceae bacterium]|nr:hypothetical protein [Atopobiaceae bacterium]
MPAPMTSQEQVRTQLVPIVLGADILIYSYIRAFHEAYALENRPIVLTTMDVKIVSSSKLCDYRMIEGVDRDEVLVEKLMSIGRELRERGCTGLVLGSGDWYARTLSQYKDQLEELLYIPYNDFELLDMLTQKDKFHRLCEQSGLRNPKTLELECAADAPEWDRDMHGIEFPCIAKPSNSAAWHFAEFEGKRKIHEPANLDELEWLYTTLREKTGYDRKLLVQDNIPGGDDSILSLTAYIDAQGTATTRVLGQVVLQDHSPQALGNPVCIINAFHSPALAERREAMNELVDRAVEMIAREGYRGYANFDVKYDERDGSFNLFEVNTRPGRNTYYVSLSGMPFVRPIVEDVVLGNALPAAPVPEEFCFTCIPQQVVRRHTTDPVLRDYVLRAYHNGLATNPLYYRADSVKHTLWARATTTNQIRKFRRYLG